MVQAVLDTLYKKGKDSRIAFLYENLSVWEKALEIFKFCLPCNASGIVHRDLAGVLDALTMMWYAICFFRLIIM
jgi:hypothetical protein